MNNDADAAADGSRGDAHARVQQARLAELDGLLAQVQQATAKAVLLVGSLAGSGTAEAVAGLPLELHLGLSARMTGADRAVFITAGETLQDLPVTARLFADGVISWGQVRGIVRAVRHLSLAQRGLVDARVAQTVSDRNGVDSFDPDELVWAVEQAVVELRDRRSVERSEQRRANGDYLAVQPDFDGGIRGWFEYRDPVAAATVLNGLDARAGNPAPTDATTPAPTPGAATSRAKQYGQALLQMCGDALAGRGTGGAPRPAKPLLLVHVDLAQVHVNNAGQVELNVRGPIPTICARTVEALTSDADLRAVLFDGARPLATSNKVRARSIPSDTRIAVRTATRGAHTYRSLPPGTPLARAPDLPAPPAPPADGQMKAPPGEPAPATRPSFRADLPF